MADKKQDDLVDAGSEYSFPASDPPAYMGGTATAGAPSPDSLPGAGVCTELTDSDEAKPAGGAPQGTDPARALPHTRHPMSGGAPASATGAEAEGFAKVDGTDHPEHSRTAGTETRLCRLPDHMPTLGS